MVKQMEFFNIQYKEGSLEPKTAEFIKFAVNLAIGHEHGAKLHLDRARKCGASEDEVWETIVSPCARLAPKCETSPRISSIARSDFVPEGVFARRAHRPNRVE